MSTVDMLAQYMDVTLSEDKMSAYVHVLKQDDPLECTVDDVIHYLRSHQVKYGINMEVLREIVSQPELYAKTSTLVASGKLPVPGKDGSMRVLINVEVGDSRPLEQEDGSVNLKELKQLQNVAKGQRIAELVPPLAGIPGMDVTGEVVDGKMGKEARFKIGKNVVVVEEDRAMYAAIDGLISKTEGEKMNVFPVFEVNGDVDYRTGNIDFIGTVVIRGNVLTGFKVKAVGDIRVYGGVEGAVLESQGSVEVSGGIIAGNKGSVNANHTIKCSFIQEANVNAGLDVIVSQSIMHAQVKAGRGVFCKGMKGLIVGGLIQAGERVEARTIGNTMSTVTTIEVGVLPDLRNELNQLRANLKVCSDNLEKTEKALRILDQLASVGQLTDEKLVMRIKLNATRKQAAQEKLNIRDRILEIERKLEETNVSLVHVTQTIYGGAKIVIGRYTRYVKDACKRATFQIVDGEVGMSSM
ncbi:FapA family protein [Paenibacillus sp. SC116]|uniref:DUF342 domain-containing protein n=1 Tax=Paenibacillus sp. SC116 TaxID=2968986 RepID=UPI00215B6572|nr:FapA family protein [Paenibacillus sp. SC116]MCR8845475.1 FapA family protein [Paenibacillus sp. SC116]